MHKHIKIGFYTDNNIGEEEVKKAEGIKFEINGKIYESDKDGTVTLIYDEN